MLKANAATAEYDEAKSAFDALGAFAANTAYGKLPAQAANQGKLMVQNNDERRQNAFMKFPISGLLKADDTITEATLKVYKFGGGGGPVVVSTTGCGWTRGSITYTNSQDIVLQRASEGVG